MRRILLFLSVLALAAIIGVGIYVPASKAMSQAQFQQVSIRITCTGGQVDDVNIQPWTAGASRSAGQQLRWRLLPGSDIGSATIRPKSNSAWPFASNPPLTVQAGGNNVVDSGAITGGDGSYYYDILADCGSGQTVIDPRMDIRP